MVPWDIALGLQLLRDISTQFLCEPQKHQVIEHKYSPLTEGQGTGQRAVFNLFTAEELL